MKCVNCGYEYFSEETLKRGICPACGRSLTVTDATYNPKFSELQLRKMNPEANAELQLKAEVSTAINVRRIALAVILAVVVIVGSYLVSLIVSVFYPDYSDQSTAGGILIAWLVAAGLIMVVGLYVIIFQKSLTRETGLGTFRKR